MGISLLRTFPGLFERWELRVPLAVSQNGLVARRPRSFHFRFLWIFDCFPSPSSRRNSFFIELFFSRCSASREVSCAALGQPAKQRALQPAAKSAGSFPAGGASTPGVFFPCL